MTATLIRPAQSEVQAAIVRIANEFSIPLEILQTVWQRGESLSRVKSFAVAYTQSHSESGRPIEDVDLFPRNHPLRLEYAILSAREPQQVPLEEVQCLVDTITLDSVGSFAQALASAFQLWTEDLEEEVRACMAEVPDQTVLNILHRIRASIAPICDNILPLNSVIADLRFVTSAPKYIAEPLPDWKEKLQTSSQAIALHSEQDCFIDGTPVHIRTWVKTSGGLRYFGDYKFGSLRRKCPTLRSQPAFAFAFTYHEAMKAIHAQARSLSTGHSVIR